MKYMRTLAFLVTLAVFAVAACAQHPPVESTPAPPLPSAEEAPFSPPPNAGKEGDGELRELIEAVMTAKLSKELGLNDEQTVLMIRRFSEFKIELDSMKRQRQEKMKALRAAVKEKQSDELIEAALNDLIDHDISTLQFKKGVYQKAADNLSVSQRAKLYVFISDFESDMRRLIQKAREASQSPARDESAPPPPQRPRREHNMQPPPDAPAPPAP